MAIVNAKPELAYYGDRTEINADYNATSRDSFIAVVGLAGPISIQLPDPRTWGQRSLEVKDESFVASVLNTITILPPLGFTIDGQSAGIVISVAGGSARFYSSRKDWFQL